MNALTYLHLKPGETPPPREARPFKAVVVINAEVDGAWRNLVSDWLVESGCRYMMAWGPDCSAWDSSVDEASLASSDFAETGDDDFVMTTWHERETFEEVFWFARFSAVHPSLELTETLIVDIAIEPRQTELMALAAAAEADERA